MAQLREAGVEVRQLCVEECARMHEQFLVHIVQKRPFVTLKSAVSLDGKIAHWSGHSKWITGEPARRRVHEMRHLHDVVLIGIGTALADNPELTVRLEGNWKQPVRVVLDAQARLPLQSKLVQSAFTTPLIVVVDENVPLEKTTSLEAAGAGVWRLPSQGGKIDLAALLQKIYEREWCSILVEGGAQVTGAFLETGLADKAAFFIAPLLMGRGISTTGDWAVENMDATRRLRAVQHQSLGNDVLISGYLNDHVTRFFTAL
jgi:diaminohydroxyphosphoribosylaminopyrimidine deaminase/5-amino-6-(5-phosphoribosylamino)uracil reductase